jgi:hypothetical protein
MEDMELLSLLEIYLKLHVFWETGDHFLKYGTNIDTYTHTGIYLYEHTYLHSTPMSTSERLSWLDFEIHEVGHQERLIINGNVAFHWKNN